MHEQMTSPDIKTGTKANAESISGIRLCRHGRPERFAGDASEASYTIPLLVRRIAFSPKPKSFNLFAEMATEQGTENLK